MFNDSCISNYLMTYIGLFEFLGRVTAWYCTFTTLFHVAEREFTGEKKEHLEIWLKKMNTFIVEMESTEKKKKHLEDLRKAMDEYIALIQKPQDTSGS